MEIFHSTVKLTHELGTLAHVVNDCHLWVLCESRFMAMDEETTFRKILYLLINKRVVPFCQLAILHSYGFPYCRLYWVDNGSIKVVNIDGSELDVLPVSASIPNLFLIYKVLMSIN